MFSEQINLSLHKIFQSIEKEGKYSVIFYDAAILAFKKAETDEER